MAVPTVVGVGTFVGTGTGASVQPPFPAGTTDNDIMVVLAEANVTVAAPTGWAHVTGSPVIGADTRLNVLWRRFVTGDTEPVLTRDGDHIDARMISVRGCKTSGDPWNNTPGTGTEAAGDTSADWPGQTTTVADCLILECIATGRDVASSANMGALTNANYANIVEQMDNWAAGGTGGGIGCVSATMASAGATGASTATMGSTDAKALMTLALEPPGGGGGVSGTMAVTGAGAVAAQGTKQAVGGSISAVSGTVDTAGTKQASGTTNVTAVGTVTITGAGQGVPAGTGTMAVTGAGTVTVTGAASSPEPPNPIRLVHRETSRHLVYREV